MDIVRRALEDPLRRIASNAGQEGSVVIEKVRQGKGSFGYNAATEEYEDLMKAGIIDPTKVVRTALQNAASVAGLLLTTEAMVAEKPKEEKAGGPAACRTEARTSSRPRADTPGHGGSLSTRKPWGHRFRRVTPRDPLCPHERDANGTLAGRSAVTLGVPAFARAGGRTHRWRAGPDRTGWGSRASPYA